MSNVVEYPKYNLHNIPEALRRLANQIESSEVDAVRCVVALEPSCSDGVIYKAFGAKPFTRAHAAGMAFCAANTILGIVGFDES